MEKTVTNKKMNNNHNHIFGAINIPPVVVRGKTDEETVKAYDNFAQFPGIGDTNKLYIDKSTNVMYRWDSDEIRYMSIESTTEEIKFIDGGTL